MRFAGMRMENFLSPNKPDMGGIAQAGMTHRSAVNNAATTTASQVNQAGVSAAAKVEAASVLGAATAAQADASTFASGMGMIGDIAGGVMGGMGNFSYAGGPGSSGTKMGAGGGSVGGFGTLGPNYGKPGW
jgi:hypothetical protein